MQRQEKRNIPPQESGTSSGSTEQQGPLVNRTRAESFEEWDTDQPVIQEGSDQKQNPMDLLREQFGEELEAHMARTQRPGDGSDLDTDRPDPAVSSYEGLNA